MNNRNKITSKTLLMMSITILMLVTSLVLTNIPNAIANELSQTN